MTENGQTEHVGYAYNDLMTPDFNDTAALLYDYCYCALIARDARCGGAKACVSMIDSLIPERRN